MLSSSIDPWERNDGNDDVCNNLNKYETKNQRVPRDINEDAETFNPNVGLVYKKIQIL